MSWDADLVVEIDGHEIVVGDWNFTHNTNGMIRKVLDVAGIDYASKWIGSGVRYKPGEPPTPFTDEPIGNWYHALSGEPGPSPVLETIVAGLMEAPSLFRSMNPPNGWGDYDSLLAVLVEMRDQGREYPSARWRTSG